MDDRKKRRIEALFTELGFDVKQDCELAKGFFLLMLLHTAEGFDPDRYPWDGTGAIEKNLARFEIHWFDGRYPELVSRRGTLAELLQRMETERLLEPKRFFSVFSPYIVANPAAYLSRFSGKGGKMFYPMVMLILLLEENAAGPGSVPKETTDLIRKHAEGLKVDPEQLRQDVFQIPFKTYDVKVPREIGSVMREYKKAGVSYHVILQDYYDVHRPSRQLETAINPWLKARRSSGVPTEAGYTEEERLFGHAAFYLRPFHPTDVIRSLFYPNSVNDSGLECGFLYREFAARSRNGGKALVINPSPDFLLAWDTRKEGTASFSVGEDSIVGCLYHQQFPDYSFSKLGEWAAGFYDNVLLMGRNLKKEAQTRLLMKGLKQLSETGHMIAEIPNVLFDRKAEDGRQLLMEELLEAGYRIERMLLLPNAATKTPNKKVIVYIRRTREGDDDGIPFYRADFFGDHLAIRRRHWVVPQARLIQEHLSLGATQKAMEAKPTEQIVRRKAAEKYVFSREIILHVTFQLRDGYWVGRTRYHAILPAVSEEKTKGSGRRPKRGKRLTEQVKRGLRGTSREAVLRNLQAVPFYPEMYGSIASDVRTAYAGRLTELSLKTIWFLCHAHLKDNGSYHREMADVMFCGECSALADLTPGKCVPEDYAWAMGQVFPDITKTEELRYWQQLNLILREAEAQRMVEKNPIREIIETCSLRATEEQREVRNALTKKTFTREEEKRMLGFITEEIRDPKGRKAVRRYEAESIYLAAAIRMFTGMPLREVCGLKWKDFRKLPDLDGYQLLVGRFADQEGKPVSHADAEDWKRYRRVPIPNLLAQMLLARRSYLESQLPEQEKPDHYAIVSRTLKKAEVLEPDTHCRPRNAADHCREVLEKAEIPEQIFVLPGGRNGETMETDLNRYRGDIFQSNFRFRANHTCGLTRGEIHYILGITAPNTFSEHYCDYINDLIQYAMGKKLERWTAGLLAEGPGPVKRPRQDFSGNLTADIVLPGGIGAVDMEISVTDSEAGLTLEIGSRHGCTGDITWCGEEGL